MVVDVLPAMADALAKPLGSIADLTVISNDGAGALSRSVAGNLHETLETVRRTTGVDLMSLLGSARPGAGGGTGGDTDRGTDRGAGGSPVRAGAVAAPGSAAPGGFGSGDEDGSGADRS